MMLLYVTTQSNILAVCDYWGGSQWGKMGKNGEKWGKNFMGKAF